MFYSSFKPKWSANQGPVLLESNTKYNKLFSYLSEIAVYTLMSGVCFVHCVWFCSPCSCHLTNFLSVSDYCFQSPVLLIISLVPVYLYSLFGLVSYVLCECYPCYSNLYSVDYLIKACFSEFLVSMQLV